MRRRRDDIDQENQLLGGTGEMEDEYFLYAYGNGIGPTYEPGDGNGDGIIAIVGDSGGDGCSADVPTILYLNTEIGG